jgi:hypothetical protein
MVCAAWESNPAHRVKRPMLNHSASSARKVDESNATDLRLSTGFQDRAATIGRYLPYF